MEIYSKLMGEDTERWIARENMQKAYITYATVSQIVGDGNQGIRSRWADQVYAAAQEHGKFIDEFREGKFYANISEDPRDTIESDEKISLKNFSNYNRQKTLAPTGVKQNEVEMSLEAENKVK